MATLRFKRSYFAMPYAFIATVFVVIPLFVLLVFAFKSGDKYSFANFVSFFTTSGTLKVMGRSLYVAFLTTLISFLLAYPIALILTNSKLNKNAILIVLFILPMWINSVMRIFAIKSFFDAYSFGFSSFTRVIIAMVYDFFPFMLLPIYTILNNMDKSLIEAAADLGSSPLFILLKIKLPLSIAGIVSGVLMVFMPTVSTFAISQIVANSTDMYLFGNLINNFFEKGHYNLGSAYAFILLIIIAGSMFVANKLTGGKIQQGAPKGGSGVV